MSTEVIITVVAGLALLLFSLLYNKKRSISLVIGTIGFLLVTYGGFTYGTLQPIPYAETFNTGNKLAIHYPITEVQVISPVNNDAVKCRILTMGVYPEGHDKDIWVLLKPSDDKYYPQSDWTNTSYKEKGEWQVVTRFGGDAGETYELIVYETTPEASSYFSETIANWKTANEYVGLEFGDIPNGATEVERITVTLEDSCRGAN
ncbi:hypothetical protein [Psychroserpens sp.]|uniref:hypothetical protein n=1 Tax=Psychroserpens sp. TaxID=2020870 RepID=UPI001B181910|nr:hypothetical protein [Psychroserpens sp.]MBO6606413.1 hypothetical protein [Psychroserpens sp.]MBO6631225.1 hypothetical protein [Psychroserpens sp.]MBO6653117.1 hypothetical protein [Psychroserpens sp.]MBO6680855.1 hypothetical protein [Psychroserpens sp.]MBO6750187.1 hypothetical protein [Psychroserpens sp.]